jgi:GNAT superfamily N-acetyltransferase
MAVKTEPMDLFMAAWKHLTGALPNPNHEEMDSVTNRFCDAPNLFFNLWFQNRPTPGESEFRTMLRTGKAASAGWAQPAGGIISSEWSPQNWQEIVADEGLTVLLQMVGMEAGAIVPPSLPPTDMDIRRVGDDEAAMAASMINAHAYHMAEEQFACCGGMHFWPEEALAFVGYVEGQPVCTAAVRPVNGTAYVYMVATEPCEQGKGYAATIMRHAMAEGRTVIGGDLLTLHATIDGMKTYEKMGFSAGAATPLIVPAG